MRLRDWAVDFWGSFRIALLTAATTLVLAILLSAVLGAENIRHREATRCHAALIVSMLRDAYAVNPAYEQIRDVYPAINLEGLDCNAYWTQPFDPNGEQ